SPQVRVWWGGGWEKGGLPGAKAEADVTIGGGEVRLAALMARTDGADLTAAGHLALSDSALDSRLTLSGRRPRWIDTAPEVSILLKGPILAPKRTIDVSALVGWLTLRSVEQQSRKLNALETGRPESALEEDSQG